MSLVAYGSSDSEEENEDQSNSSLPLTIDDTPSSSTSPPAAKKQRETVRITIPSLEQFKDEEGESKPVKKPTFKSGSGLFSILPPPKHTTSSITKNFTPHILTKQKESKNKPLTSKPIQKETATFKTSCVSSLLKDEHVSENVATSEDVQCDYKDKGTVCMTDYFSLETSNINETVTGIHDSNLFSMLPKPAQSTDLYTAMPLSHEETSTSLMSSRNEITQNDDNISGQNWAENCSTQRSYDANYASEQISNNSNASAGNEDDAPLFLNDEDFLKMKGKRRKEEINIIDVKADDQLTGKDEWLMQSLTEEKVHRPSKRRHDMPTQQQKRKHQITYLAFQAKEREMDLKNQWALNSRTRRETQAKYGF